MEIFRCTSCSLYTIKQQCPSCTAQAITPKPARYSPEDKYGKWRRKAKLVDAEGSFFGEAFLSKKVRW